MSEFSVLVVWIKTEKQHGEFRHYHFLLKLDFGEIVLLVEGTLTI